MPLELRRRCRRKRWFSCADDSQTMTEGSFTFRVDWNTLQIHQNFVRKLILFEFYSIYQGISWHRSFSLEITAPKLSLAGLPSGQKKCYALVSAHNEHSLLAFGLSSCFSDYIINVVAQYRTLCREYSWYTTICCRCRCRTAMLQKGIQIVF